MTLLIIFALLLVAAWIWPDPYEAPHPAHRLRAEADASAERYEGKSKTHP